VTSPSAAPDDRRPDVEVVTLPLLLDNYGYLVVWGGEAAVVDPAEADPVLAELDRRRLKLRQVLITHHHHDHIGGLPDLRRAAACEVIGPDDPRIPGLTRRVGDGDRFELGPIRIETLATPGHGRTHLCYHAPRPGFLFSGDILFVAGCGRILEGSAQQMWSSLQRLAARPDETQVYCGHEYTEENLRFAAQLQPDFAPVLERQRAVQALLRAGRPSVPTTVGVEKRTNPFLRAGAPDMKRAVDMVGAADLEVFAELRRRKDVF
jgi:hydroxyacylglutathione hydrolase